MTLTVGSLSRYDLETNDRKLLEVIGLVRLQDEIKCPSLNGIHCKSDIGEGGHEHHGHVRVLDVDCIEKLKPRHIKPGLLISDSTAMKSRSPSVWPASVD